MDKGTFQPGAGHALGGGIGVVIDIQTQKVFDLSRKYCNGYTRRKTYYYGIRYKFDNITQLEYPHHYQHYTCHNSGYKQSGKPMLLNDTIHYHYESSGGSAYLYPTAAEKRYYKTRYYSCYQARGVGKYCCFTYPLG